MPEIPLFPLNSVLFPEMIMPLHIFEERYKSMIKRCIDESIPFGVTLIRSGKEVGGPADPFVTGTTARIAQVQRVEDGRLNLLAVGQQRFRLRSLRQDEPYLVGEIEPAPLEPLSDEEIEALEDVSERVTALYAEHYRLQVYMQGSWEREVSLPSNPERLAYVVAAGLQAPPLLKQELLEMDSLQALLSRENELLGEAIPLQTVLLAASRRERFGRLGALS